MALSYDVDLTTAAPKKGKGRSLFSGGAATGDRALALPATALPKHAAADAADDRPTTTSSARAAASATGAEAAATSMTTKKRSSRLFSPSSSSSAKHDQISLAASAASIPSQAVADAFSAKLMARTLQSMPVAVVQESTRVMTGDNPVVIGITAVERSTAPRSALAATPAAMPVSTSAGKDKVRYEDEMTKKTNKTVVNRAGNRPAPAKAQPSFSRASNVTFVQSEEKNAGSDREDKLGNNVSPAPGTAPVAPSTQAVGGANEDKGDGGGSGGKRGGSAVVRAGSAVGCGCRHAAGAFGSGVITVGRDCGRSSTSSQNSHLTACSMSLSPPLKPEAPNRKPRAPGGPKPRTPNPKLQTSNPGLKTVYHNCHIPHTAQATYHKS